MKRSRSVGTHDGTFHGDEVTACALLIVFDCIDENKIVRTRDQKLLDTCEFVCDVGGIFNPSQKLFDHHQVTYKGELSSAGMILDYLRQERIISEEGWNFLNRTLIFGVDAHDNGRAPQTFGYCTFSHIVSNFNPADLQCSPDEQNRAFFQALHFVIGHIQRSYNRFLYEVECRKLIKAAMEKNRICLFFDQMIPWVEGFFALNGRDHPAWFVIMPAGDHWKLRGIPPDYEHRMQVRLPLPENWAGLLGEELKQASGVSGAVFCHKGRFTSVWETKEDAINALKKILSIYGVSDEDNI